MLYFLGQLGDSLAAFNVFRYITFRTAGAVVTALFFVFLFGPGMIAGLRIRQGRGQPIREDGPAGHLLTKKGTPTMGGLMILAGAVTSILLWANLTQRLCLGGAVASPFRFGAIGFYDDYLKVKRMSHNGFSGRQRLVIEAHHRADRRLHHRADHRSRRSPTRCCSRSSRARAFSSTGASISLRRSSSSAPAIR